MTPTPTHMARCLDDDLLIPLVLDPEAGLCSSCGEVLGAYLVLAEGAGWICSGCLTDLSWTVWAV